MKSSYCTGLKIQGRRPTQEDEFRFHSDRGIFSVADGFGGPLPGARASKSACEWIESFLLRGAQDLDATLPFVLRSYISLAGNVLFNALIYANQKILEENRKKNVNERGGASVVTGFIDGDHLALANVGSCGAWLIRGKKAVSLVTPRTYGRLFDPFSKEWASSSNCAADVPLGALGIYEDLEPEITECRIMPDDWLLLQTDGVKIVENGPILGQLFKIKQKKLTKKEAALEAVGLFKNSPEIVDNLSIVLHIF